MPAFFLIRRGFYVITPNSDLKVWLEFQSNDEQIIVVPWIVSGREVTTKYTITVRVNSNYNSIIIKQDGFFFSKQDEAQKLTSVGFTKDIGDICTIEILLSEKTVKEQLFKFKC